MEGTEGGERRHGDGNDASEEKAPAPATSSSIPSSPSTSPRPALPSLPSPTPTPCSPTTSPPSAPLSLPPFTRGLEMARQPLKVALAYVLVTLTMLILTGPRTPWGLIAVCQSLSSHPGSSFKAGLQRIQGTVLGGMFGIVVLNWLQWDSKLAVVLSLTGWVFFCAFNRLSPLYGEVALMAAVTAPIILMGPILGEAGAMIRIQQTILGSFIYVFVDNVFWPVRAKLDLRRELLTSLGLFRDLWGRTFSIFLQKTDDPVHAIQTAQRVHAALTASCAMQETYITLAVDEPELWHKPFHAQAYRRVAKALARVSLFMAMLIRASQNFPLEISERDRALLTSIQEAVQELERMTAHALDQAWEAVARMTEREEWREEEEGEEDETETEGKGRSSAVMPLGDRGDLPPPQPREGRASGHGAHRESSGHRPTRSATLPPDTVPALALLQLGEAYVKIQDWVDGYFEEHIKGNWANDQLVLVSADLILSLNGMIFAVEALGQGLLGVGHALRELVEREKGNYYML